LQDREIGPVTVLFGRDGGKYPDGNSLLVRGSRETIIVDPALGVVARRDRLPRVDRVFNSHCHEDHIAGNHLWPDVPWHCHEADALGFRSLDGLMEIYGLPKEIEGPWRETCVDTFHYASSDDVHVFRDGDVFDLGEVSLRVVHTPGHTRGHSAFVVQWGAGGPDERLVYLGDIDLSSFGPYYGDAWSDLMDFERSLRTVRELDAAWYATFHHIGVVDRPLFEERLDRFEVKIALREAALLDYLQDPRSLDEIAAHRFVYRPGPAPPMVEIVERRSMGMHIERLIAQDRIEEVEPGRYLVVEQ
jgi:glyoxylase-like metal-dependent hydrolase (beta-lactamase superfamily II)